ncbi:hypothetical protein GCM10009559_59620 [Pseudonocardia zijingensis]|uniref:Uncharacterized protein n=1 Tax=Pseudonocardia zijingensis TaxID=153376 RepID=A0ABN1NA83_9PSEU
MSIVVCTGPSARAKGLVVGQNWWLVVLAVVVVALLVAVALIAGRRRRGGTPSSSDTGIATTAAGGSTEQKPADDAEEHAPAPQIPAPREELQPTAPPEADADADAPPAPRRPDSAGSALAALDSGLVGPASTFTAAAAAVTAATARPGPYPGSLLPAVDGSNPSPEHQVKAHEGSHRYHTPDSPFYQRTRGDVWFRSAEEARAAGFTAWDAR